MQKITSLFFLFFTLISCNTKESNTIDSSKNSDFLQTENKTNPAKETELKESDTFADTVAVRYDENKMILGILPLLPDKSMDTWKWDQKERTEMVQSISKHNYFIDTIPNYNTLKYIKPNTIGLQVVDGFWTISIYKMAENNFIVITNNVTGDGNDIVSFEYKNGSLKEIETNTLFQKSLKDLLKDGNDKTCVALFEENFFTFDYDFKDSQNVTISSWLLNKEENENCLKGNTLNYKFMAEKGKFELESISWK